jgi:hypothetical protein
VKFTAEHYFRASLERTNQAKELYKHGQSYALAMYCGGLAVECLLRAFRWQEDSTFEGRHDLSDLLKASGLLKIEEKIRESALKIQVAMNQIVILWHNNLRFASEARLGAFLKQKRMFQGVKGDPLKKNALDLIEAAQTVVNRGAVLWTSGKKS